MTTPVHEDLCWHDGRGPELRRVHWGPSGLGLVAIDYINPDGDESPLNHVRFFGVQVVLVTPEEVINLSSRQESRAAILDLGRSPWLESFAPQHLERCHHFQVLFYDEQFDVICERVHCHVGGYSLEEREAAQQGAATDKAAR